MFNAACCFVGVLTALLCWNDVHCSLLFCCYPDCSADCVLIAAGILAVEAYHAGYIRTALIQNGDVVTPYGANVTTIINAISAARDSLDGDDHMAEEGIFNATTGDYTLAPVDDNAVAFSRNPAQVLAVAYLNPTGAAGGFFPNGVNGKIQYA